jgi:hypothetical protein
VIDVHGVFYGVGKGEYKPPRNPGGNPNAEEGEELKIKNEK